MEVTLPIKNPTVFPIKKVFKKINNINYLMNRKSCLVAVVGQRYAVNVMDEHVLRGNAAILKCHIPSFVAEFVEVDSWVQDESTNIYARPDYGTSTQFLSFFFSSEIYRCGLLERLALFPVR